MKLNDKQVLVCNCEGTMTIDGKALAKAFQQEAPGEAARPGVSPENKKAAKARTGTKKESDKKAGQLDVSTHLCRTQIEEFQRLAGNNDSLLVACTQEAPVFLETLEEMQQEARTGEARTGKQQETRTGEARTGKQQEARTGETRTGKQQEAPTGETRTGKQQEARTGEARTGKHQEAPKISFTNIRERAGWSKDATGKPAQKTNVTAKIAALLAEAAMDIEDAQSVTMVSGGALLILGKDETALDAAKKVSSRLDVTVLLQPGSDLPPPALMDVPVFTGRVTAAEGHLGQFQVAIDDFAPATPSSKSSLVFDGKGQSGTSVCDLILDLRGATPLFTAPEKRDGYYNPDPGNPALVGDALLELTDMVGEFQKPRYVDYDEAICAHARSGITGCTRCVDHCPTGAITPDGDRVNFDPYICAGCGACASVCPTGAARYALPAGDTLFKRLRTLIRTYRAAGGKTPVVLVADTEFGTAMIDAMARSGGGLPGNVLPFSVNETTQIGLDFLLAAGALGVDRTLVLLPPGKADEKAGLESEMALAGAVFDGLGYGKDRAQILEETDPDALEKTLYGLKPLSPMPDGDFLPLGRKRSVMTLALGGLHRAAPTPVDELALPEGAPFGTVQVDVEGCTLCLACVGACPTGAFKDNEDKPQLSFAEEACVQCGLCKNTCPENVISLVPRLSFTEAARSHQVVKEEEPFECIRCGKPFGTRSTIETMVKKLEGHSMFQDKGGVERLKMCEDCRVFAITEEDIHPLASGVVPIPRTTDDYLKERDELRKSAARDMREKGLKPTGDDGGGEG